MTSRSRALKSLLVAAAISALAYLAPAPAQAQNIFYDWNGGSRQMVPIGPGYLGDDADALIVEDAFGGRHRYP